MNKKNQDAPPDRLIPDDEQDKTLETLARKQARLTTEVAARKAALEETGELIVSHLKKRKNRVYVHGAFKLYIEAKEKLHVEVEDETGEME